MSEIDELRTRLELIELANPRIYQESVYKVNDSGYLYIIHVREFIGRPIYKIGRAADLFDRFKQYSKGSKLLHSVFVKDHKQAESICKTRLKAEYTQKREYGTEYFEGNFFMMREVLNTIANDSRFRCMSDNDFSPIVKEKNIKDDIELKIRKRCTDILTPSENGYVSRLTLLNTLRSHIDMYVIPVSTQKEILDKIIIELGGEFRDRMKVDRDLRTNLYWGVSLNI